MNSTSSILHYLLMWQCSTLAFNKTRCRYWLIQKKKYSWIIYYLTDSFPEDSFEILFLSAILHGGA